MRTIPLLGLDFADLTVAEAAAAIAARPADGQFEYVVTPNADHLVRISRDPALAPLYRAAWLRLLDSRAVAKLASLFGLSPPPVTPGSDLTALLLERYVQPGERIAIVGLKPEWLTLVVARYGLAPPYHYDPPIGFDSDPVAFADTVSFVLAHPARFVFLAVGSPRQERLAAAVAKTGRATGTALCIGSSLAFLAGAERRAPTWMRNQGLEWAYRLASNPRRLARRYLLDSPLVIPMLLRERAGRSAIAQKASPSLAGGAGGEVETTSRSSVPTRDGPAP
jgi:exopolysaccharide biosynthesis WecB/TagA/CpsF family protein